MRGVIAALVALVIAAAGCASAETSREPQGSEAAIIFPEKTLEGTVTVSLTPGYDNAGTLKVKYDLNTHTVDLSAINLQQQVMLQMGGKNFSPENAPVLQGHHVSGVLDFRIGELGTPFSMVVTNVPDVEERVFEWDSNVK